MGVDTKGVVLTDQREFWQISQRIGNAIYRMIRERKPGVPVFQMSKEGWKFPSLTVMESFHSLEYKPTEYFQLHFMYDGEQRMLHVHTDCDGDLTEEFGEGAKGVILSLGMWGSSTEIMKGILKSVSDLGPVYILEDDTGDNWEKVK